MPRVIIDERLQVKRVYEAPDARDGTRVLVDRLWPRGIAKDKAHIDLWLRDVAPSDAPRRRFHAKPEVWDAFLAAYGDELDASAARDALRTLADLRRAGPVMLLYAARDGARNNAVALVTLLEHRRSNAFVS
ncbi:MAG: DUF488 family protein [Alphaproteobacteria bacterium]|nr:DUF488 family protein [Alphaproteobacteria bacterium]